MVLTLKRRGSGAMSKSLEGGTAPLRVREAKREFTAYSWTGKGEVETKLGVKASPCDKGG